MSSRFVRALPWLALAAGSVFTPHALAQDTTPPAPVEPAAAAEATKGILPIPTYAGDFWQRSYILGDLGGHRTKLAEKGIQFDINWNQTLQSVADGGRDTDTKYGGSLDYNLNLDLQKMNVLPGALVKFRAESRYGEAANDIAGPILPVNTDGFFPLTSEIDESIPVTVTDLNYVQYLSTTFGLLLGKFTTLDGDPNEFASGRGTSQFLNANFIFSPTTALSTPYSTLGGGAIWAPAKWVMLTSLIYTTDDSSTTSGFQNFDEGWTWSAEADFQYKLGKLPGGMNIGGYYAWDTEFNKINGRLVFQPGQGLSTQTDDDTWTLYWSGWQYLYVEEDSDAPIVLTNGEPDRQGIGLFGRASTADQDTNPIEWSASGGIGARGLIPSRDNDMLGVGYYYMSLQQTRLSGLADVDDHASGFEAFYNLAITPAVHLTFDVQWVQSPLPNVDDATLLGARLNLRF